MPGAYTPWEDVSLPDSLVSRQMRLNTSGKHSIEYHVEQDCEEILDLNKALRNEENFSGSLWGGRD